MAARKKEKKSKAKPAKKGGKDRYPRQARGRFGKSTQDFPNPGKPIGAQDWRHRKISKVARDYLDDGGDDAVRFLLRQRKNIPALLATVEWLTERADGKAPQTVRHGLDPESPEGILLALSNQPLPGQHGGSDDDKEGEG